MLEVIADVVTWPCSLIAATSSPVPPPTAGCPGNTGPATAPAALGTPLVIPPNKLFIPPIAPPISGPNNELYKGWNGDCAAVIVGCSGAAAPPLPPITGPNNELNKGWNGDCAAAGAPGADAIAG